MSDFDELRNRAMRALMNNASTTSAEQARTDAGPRWFKSYADYTNCDFSLSLDEINSYDIYKPRPPDPLEVLRDLERAKATTLHVPRPQPYQPKADAIAAAREAGAAAERARIMGKLEALKPTETQYTRIQWRWEERGAADMYAKVIKAICGEKGEA